MSRRGGGGPGACVLFSICLLSLNTVCAVTLLLPACLPTALDAYASLAVYTALQCRPLKPTPLPLALKWGAAFQLGPSTPPPESSQEGPSQPKPAAP